MFHRQYLIFIIIFSFCASCGSTPEPPETVIVEDPGLIDEKTSDVIRLLLHAANDHEGRGDEQLLLSEDSILSQLYKAEDFRPLWNSSEQWLPAAGSLINYIGRVRYAGLIPDHYHYEQLQGLKKSLDADTGASGIRRDAAVWARADLLCTDAFVKLVRHLKLGRLPADSISQRADTLFSTAFCRDLMKETLAGSDIDSVLWKAEPSHAEYRAIRNAMRAFVDSADMKEYTFIQYPNPNKEDLYASLRKRLEEEGFVDTSSVRDSASLARILKRYQAAAGLEADGLPGPATTTALNETDLEKFYRLAVTLDRYKLLPPELPGLYLWVNIPSYYLKLVKNDTQIIRSPIIVGKSYTRTPVLNSRLTDMITYPQWTVPESIIAGEILPAAKKDPGYFAKKGFSLVNNKGDVIDPWFVDWSLYNRSIPFRVVQGSGDDNALGILKFNFSNKYAVYLHDTNQRYLFGRAKRALSHGCVRVKEWEKLAFYIIHNDSISTGGTRYTSVDSVRKWLRTKEKRVIPVRNRIPLFIRYFTCEAIDGQLMFHEDVYGEDRRLAMRYISNK